VVDGSLLEVQSIESSTNTSSGICPARMPPHSPALLPLSFSLSLMQALCSLTSRRGARKITSSASHCQICAPERREMVPLSSAYARRERGPRRAPMCSGHLRKREGSHVCIPEEIHVCVLAVRFQSLRPYLAPRCNVLRPLIPR